MFDLANDDVTGHYWRGLNSFRTAFSQGEPLSQHPGVGVKIAEWLLERGLIETVNNSKYHEQCYRVTNLGHQVLARDPKARPSKRPRLKMKPPRLRITETTRVKPFRRK